MAQPTHRYVDPSIDANSGSGTEGSPWGDLQYGLDQVTRDTTNGDQFNVKAGTDEVLTAALNLTTYGTPTIGAPLIFRGYTSAANDGGIGGISGNATYTMITPSTLDYIAFVDMHLHNSGSASVLTLDDQNAFIRCEIDNSTGHGINIGSNNTVVGCHIHNIGGYGCNMNSGFAGWNYFENGTNDFSPAALRCSGSITTFYRNIVKVDGSTNGIRIRVTTTCMNNSIWSNGGTGSGIDIDADSAISSIVANNIVEGFSDTGGIGYELNRTGCSTHVFCGNASYDNETHYSAPDWYFSRWGDGTDTNETLSASAFTDATNGNFSPVDTGSIKEGSLPADFGDGQ